MKPRKDDIHRVIEEEIAKDAEKDAASFPTTSKDWDAFKDRFARGDTTEASGRPANPFRFRIILGLLAATAAVVFLMVRQTEPASLRFAMAEGIRSLPGDTTQATNLVPLGAVSVSFGFSERWIQLKFEGGSTATCELTPTPELNLRNETDLRVFRVASQAPLTVQARSLDVSGTLQLRVVPGAAPEAPSQSKEIRSAVLRVRFSASDGKTQEQWYEFTQP